MPSRAQSRARASTIVPRTPRPIHDPSEAGDWEEGGKAAEGPEAWLTSWADPGLGGSWPVGRAARWFSFLLIHPFLVQRKKKEEPRQ